MKKNKNKNKRTCSNCKISKSLSEFSKNNYYCKVCSSNYQKKINSRHYIYLIISKIFGIIYIGGAKSAYRASNHLESSSHLNMELDDWVNLGIDRIVFIDISKIAEMLPVEYFDFDIRDIRFVAENILIEEFQPTLNTRKAKINTEEDLVEGIFLLLQKFLDADIFVEKNICIEEFQGKKVIVNKKDLIFRPEN